MHTARWLTRALLLTVVLALAAGCATPQETGRPPTTDTPPIEATPQGCIREGQVGDGGGDITNEQPCPTGGDGSINGTTGG